ncbi:MAG: hypothetical protein JEY99_03280 [Spirochaetales bacterium]|nr:hypothetical protein [Spirochaetales bacterium]
MKYRKVILFLFILLIFQALPLFTENVESSTEIDWETGVLRISVTATLPDSDSPLPLVKHQVLQSINREFPGYLREALLPLTVDSFNTFGEAIQQNPDLIHTINRLADEADLISTRMNLSLTALIMEYQVPLRPLLVEPFVTSADPTPLHSFMTYEPSAPFTGIVIYAADSLPVYGERDLQGMTRTEKITPCFFPRIFNEGGWEIFGSVNMKPEFLKSRGIAAYIKDTDLSAYAERIGDYPFYTTARGLYGKYHTDIILSEEDIRRFLSLEENHRLLSEGRIVIIH